MSGCVVLLRKQLELSSAGEAATDKGAQAGAWPGPSRIAVCSRPPVPFACGQRGICGHWPYALRPFCFVFLDLKYSVSRVSWSFWGTESKGLRA